MRNALNADDVLDGIQRAGHDDGLIFELAGSGLVIELIKRVRLCFVQNKLIAAASDCSGVLANRNWRPGLLSSREGKGRGRAFQSDTEGAYTQQDDDSCECLKDSHGAIVCGTSPCWNQVNPVIQACRSGTTA